MHFAPVVVALLLSAFSLSACAPHTQFTKTGEPPGLMRARPAADVQVFFGVNPQRAYVDVGGFERAPSDYMNDSLVDLVSDFRRSAAHTGCDGVVVPTPTKITELVKEAKDKAAARCLMYTPAAPASQPNPPKT